MDRVSIASGLVYCAAIAAANPIHLITVAALVPLGVALVVALRGIRG